MYARWKALLQTGVSVSRLMEFHASHKFLVMAHSNVVYGQLGRMLSGLSVENLHETADSYIAMLLEALKRPATSWSAPRKQLICNLSQNASMG